METVPTAVAQTVIPALFFCAVYFEAQSMTILIRLIKQSERSRHTNIEKCFWVSISHNKKTVNVLFRNSEITESKRKKWVKRVTGIRVPLLPETKHWTIRINQWLSRH